jgi:hypothetical protein
MRGVEILQVFQKGKEGDEKAVVSKTLETGTINALIYRAVDRLLFSKQWAEAATGLVLVTGRAIQTLMEQRLEEKSGFSILVDGLEVPTLTGANQVVSAWKKWKLLEPLPGVQVDAAIKAVCDLTFEDLMPLQSVQDLRAVYGAISVRWFCPPETKAEAFLKAIGASEPVDFITAKGDQGIKLGQHNVQVLEVFQEGTQMTDEPIEAISLSPEPKPKVRHRRKTLSVDPDLLRTAATSFGIEIRGRGGANGLSYEAALGQLLEHLTQGQSPSVPPTTPKSAEDEGAISAIKDQAKTLAWLTGRMEALEQQVVKLQQERDEAIHQVNQRGDSAQVEFLQQENQRLREERDEASSKLHAFRQLLLGTGMPAQQTVEGENSQPPQSRSTPLSTQPPTDPPEPPKPSRKRIPEEDALGHIRRAVQAIMNLNDQEGRAFDDKWYISFPVVQTLLRAYGLSANQKNVSVVFDEMKDQLDNHHDKHHLGSRHNRRHPNIGKIKEVVTLNH